MVSEKEEFDENKGVIRICMSKENRQHNGLEKKYKRITTIYKTYTSTKSSSNTSPIETGGEFGCSGRVGSICSTSGTFLFLIIFLFLKQTGIFNGEANLDIRQTQTHWPYR
jgi:heme/copper-type cytochrome/quinol oxidase subunit 1